MRRLLLLSLPLVACTHAEVVAPSTPASAPEVVAQPAPVPVPEDPLLQRCRKHLDSAKTERITLVMAGEQSPVDTDVVLRAYNKLATALDNADNESGLMRAVHPEARVRDAASECERLVAARRTELSLDRPLYDVFAKLDVATRPADEKRLIEKTIDEFKRAGVDKDEGTRARLKVLNDELVEVGQKFDKAIAADTRSVEVPVAQLKGLPQDWIDAHKPGADGKVKVTTNYPDYIPVMSYAEDDALRKQLYIVYRQRGWPENQQNLAKMLALRAEQAKLLGFANWADYITANKMIRSEKNVADFIARITAASEKRMRAEYAVLLAELQRQDPKIDAVEDWQQSYALGQAKKHKFEFDAQALRPYLHYDKVKNGLLALTSKLFHVTYKPNTTAPKWHPDVEAYDVYEGEKLYGTIYLDMHPREDKYKHAAQFSLQNGIAGVQLPVGVLVCNFPNPKTGNGLMEHKEVETFFHEFGHLIHHVFGGQQKWARFSGVATEWDFVEAPSQIFEEWSKDYETLKGFATDDKGVVIPKPLVDKLRASDDFGKALWVRHQMFYAALSLNMHNRDPGTLDQDKLVEEIQNKYSAWRFVAGTHMQASFGHLNGYSAMYYTYMWSMVIAKDMFSAFQKAGVLDPATALRYRKAILEPGGSKDAADLVADFLGRKYGFQSYEDWLNQKKKGK